MNERLIIIDEMEKPTMTLDEVMLLCNEKKIDFVIDDYIPDSVEHYYVQAIRARDNKRQSRLTDIVLRDKLEILLKGIDKSAMSEPESDAHKAILDRYRSTPKNKKD